MNNAIRNKKRKALANKMPIAAKNHQLPAPANNPLPLVAVDTTPPAAGMRFAIPDSKAPFDWRNKEGCFFKHNDGRTLIRVKKSIFFEPKNEGSAMKVQWGNHALRGDVIIGEFEHAVTPMNEKLTNGKNFAKEVVRVFAA